MPKTSMRMQFFSAGLETPTTLPVEFAKLADDEPVIGIEAGGKARAYHVPTMCSTTRHIVNDVLGGVGVSVTYCDLSDCARAFGGGAHTSPLDVSQAGLLDGRMLIKIGGVTYSQETGEIAETDPGKAAVPFPYAPFPLTRATWGEWKLRHPDTDIYVSAALLGDRTSKSRP
ncbi:MAG: DUF3179 domain-containing (seleno)protein [Isosphaeraceae bacterium]|nr:DUF3179 domain-containing (seleno)protein [Isosphaeraceae bacterium]